jgi:hypothetical protein
VKTLGLFDIPHDDLTAWIFWLLLALLILVAVDLVIHWQFIRDLNEAFKENWGERNVQKKR